MLLFFPPMKHNNTQKKDDLTENRRRWIICWWVIIERELYNREQVISAGFAIRAGAQFCRPGCLILSGSNSSYKVLSCTVTCVQAWALFKGKFREGIDKPDPPTWKTRLRCALNKSNDFEELVERSQLDISDPYKVYRIIPEGAKKSQCHLQLSLAF